MKKSPDECPLCHLPLIKSRTCERPLGAIVGDFPGEAEIEQGIPFIGPGGRILRVEMTVLGLDVNFFTITNIWHHARPADKGRNKVSKESFLAEHKWHLAQTIRAVRDHSPILLLGSDASRSFLNVSAESMSGVWTKSYLLPGSKIMVAPNPVQLLHGTVGEFRLALERYVRGVRKEENYQYHLELHDVD